MKIGVRITKYKFEVMTQQQAEDIASNWHYDGEFSFYDIESDEEDLVEFLDPEKRGYSIFVVIDTPEVIGFFSFNKVANSTIDIGLGMRPDLTGNGSGLEFLKAGLDFAKSKYNPEIITLSVATFNQSSQFHKCLLMNNTRIFEVYSFEFVKNFGSLIGVKGGDSSGKSVSRCDPAESVANEEAHGPPVESVRP